MGIWPQRTEIIDMPARISVSTSLLQDDYDWLSDGAHRIGVSMSRIVADIISDYRVSLASADAHKAAIEAAHDYTGRVSHRAGAVLTDEDELREFDERISEEEWIDDTKR